MIRSRRGRSGMTLIEMLAAVVILMMMTVIIAQVFSAATRAASKGKGMGEIYQVARALERVMSRDIGGATPNFFSGGEAGRRFPMVGGMPPGPYQSDVHGVPATPAELAVMHRMLMGGSDYIAFSTANAGGTDKSVAKVFYVLRATGELVRVTYGDTNFTVMDYLVDAAENNVDWQDPWEMSLYEDRRVMAENVTRVKFSFLDRGTRPISDDAQTYANGVWSDEWEWTTSSPTAYPVNQRNYLPAAVKVEVQIVDRLWKIADGDRMTTRFSDPEGSDDELRPEEMYDSDDGESFQFIVELPLGMKRAGT